MHELSIAQDILEIVRQNLPATNAPSVRAVKIRIGDMAGVVADSLEFCFQAITSKTSFEGTALIVEHVPVNLRCNNCGRENSLEHLVFICPWCGSTDIDMISGNELQVVEIDVDEPLET